MAIQDYCIGLKGAVNAIHRVTRALSGNVNSTTISDAVEEVAIAIENGGGGGGGGTTDHTKLQNRDSADQHPISAITGLETELNEKANASTTYTKSEVDSSLTTKQDTLVSGTNIKTINNTSLLGSGNIDIQGGESNIFIAVRGVTSYADVVQAINDGKAVVVKIDNDGSILFPMKQGVSAQAVGFGGIAYVGAGETYGSITVKSDDTWTYFNYDANDVYVNFGQLSADLRDYTTKTYVDNADNNLQSQINALEAPIQTQGNWMYKVYSDGTFDAWYKATGQSLTITATSGNLYRSELQTLILPTDLTDGKTVTIQTATPGVSHNNYPVWGILANIQGTEVRYYALSGGSRTNSPNYIITAHVFGTIQ